MLATKTLTTTTESKPTRSTTKAAAAAAAAAERLPWPPGLRPTPMRVLWHQRLAKLPPALSLKDVAARLNEPYPSVAFWVKAIGYPFTKLRRGRKSLIDWDKADWSMKNCDIARQFGVTGERVRQIRLARNLPPATRLSDGGRRFRDFLHKNRRRLHKWSIREMIAASGAPISPATAHVILKQVKGKER